MLIGKTGNKLFSFFIHIFAVNNFFLDILSGSKLIIYERENKITKEFRFEGAHALPNYDGLCRHIHGHSYILYVTIEGVPEQDKSSHKYGMIMDFKDLKAIVNDEVLRHFDHALVLRRDSPGASELSEQYGNVVVVDFQPTCENLITYFAECIGRRLPVNVKLYSLRLYETATSYAEWINE